MSMELGLSRYGNNVPRVLEIELVWKLLKAVEEFLMFTLCNLLFR